VFLCFLARLRVAFRLPPLIVGITTLLTLFVFLRSIDGEAIFTLEGDAKGTGAAGAEGTGVGAGIGSREAGKAGASER
jgi:hypothetical protein